MNTPSQRGAPGRLAPIPFTSKWWKNEGALGQTFPPQDVLKRRIRTIIDQAEYDAAFAESDEALIAVLRRHHT